MTTELFFILAGVVIVFFIYNHNSKPSVSGVEIATANAGTYLPDDYISGIISSHQNDMPWNAQKPVEVIKNSALNDVAYPMFDVNMPRLDDRTF
jgi:hypothetical protein